VIAVSVTPHGVFPQQFRDRNSDLRCVGRGANRCASRKVRSHGSQVAGRDGSQPRRKHAIKLIMIGVIVTIAS
jgi:hypothetical protein